ncbi:unnamed protein product [Cyclocybe aegerita]|uniref:Uncharacterized protein n=1 Tax=Cyclocybe aegerita TaxID=1973307 RepID=A0A8S0WL45_CYCAE|nr:unnamed protein product [Cyclocybe aegerita]
MTANSLLVDAGNTFTSMTVACPLEPLHHDLIECIEVSYNTECSSLATVPRRGTRAYLDEDRRRDSGNVVARSNWAPSPSNISTFLAVQTFSTFRTASTTNIRSSSVGGSYKEKELDLSKLNSPNDT